MQHVLQQVQDCPPELPPGLLPLLLGGAGELGGDEGVDPGADGGEPPGDEEGVGEQEWVQVGGVGEQGEQEHREQVKVKHACYEFSSNPTKR